MKRISLIALGVCIAAAGYGWLAREAAAQEKPGVKLSAKLSTADMLKLAQANGLRLNFNLEGGVQYTAKVREAGPTAVVLQEPLGKEFYDVYVPIEQIVSLELKVRDR